MAVSQRPTGQLWCAILTSLLSVGIAVWLSTPADARPGRQQRVDRRTARALAAAERAFGAGRYQETIEQLDRSLVRRRLARLPAHHPLARRALFLHAYARYKLGQHERSARLLDGLLHDRDRPDPEATLLRAMIAVESRDWSQAQQLLEPVISSGEMPWAETAARLRQRVEAELEQQRRLARERAETERRARRETEYQQAIERARQTIERGQLETASVALRRAARLRPGRALTCYYQGYLAYKQGDYRRAKARLRAALAIDGSDGWARYMLALTIHEEGDTARARTLLGGLADSARDLEVRRVARKALARLDVETVTAAPGNDDSGLSARLELGTGVDTNPAYLDETAATDVVLAMQAAARLGFRRRLGRRFELGVGGALVERTYLAGGGDGVDHTEPRGWLSLAALDSNGLSLSATYACSLVLYGHEPLLSLHAGELSLRAPLGSPRLELDLTGWGGWRGVHDADYAYFEAARAGGSTRLRLSLSRVSLGVGFELVRDWADAVETPFARAVQISGGSTTRQGRGSGDQSDTIYEEAIYRTDYTMLEHGPLLWGELRLPWKLTLSAGSGLRWRRFDDPDLELDPDTGAVTGRHQRRRDLRLSVDAQLARPLGAGFELGLRFESTDNWSNVEYLARDYSRRLAELVLRWTWPPSR